MKTVSRRGRVAGPQLQGKEVLAGVQKEAAHTALSDVRDSIAELRHYRNSMGMLAGLPAG